MKFAILATGPSLTAEQCEAVRHLRVIAVSDAYRLAPWAEVLVSTDRAWWDYHKPEFAGIRYSGPKVQGCKQLEGSSSGINSGVLALRVARSMGATEVILLGYDGHGSHFFGEHPRPLSNTTEHRQRAHNEQHRQEAFACHWNKVKILNCTPGTALTCYPTARLEECLKLSAGVAPARTNTSCAASLAC